MSHRTALAALIAGWALLAVPVLAQEQAATAPATKVKIGVSGRPDQAMLEIAIHRGYFAQQGIDIETVRADSGMEFVSSLATNQLQVASGSPNAGLFNALNRGINIRIVADFAHVDAKIVSSVSVVVRSDLIGQGAVKGVADLKGRTVAGGPGQAQYPDVLFDRIFTEAGLAPGDVTVRYLTFADSLSALANKSIDGAFMVEPLVTEGERRNIAKVLVNAANADPGAELSVVYYAPDFARQNAAAVGFMTAYLEGVRDYYDAFFRDKDRDAVVKLLVQSLPIKDPSLWVDARHQATDLNGQINVADLKRQAAFYKRRGFIAGDVPDLDRYVDPQFAEAAVRRIGVR